MKLINPSQNNLDYRSNNLNQKLFTQKSDKSKKKRLRKFIRIKSKNKTNKNNIKPLKHKKHYIKEDKNNQFYDSYIYSTQKDLFELIESRSNNLMAFNEEDKFDSKKSNIDLLESNHNKIKIEGYFESEENSQVLKNETIFVGITFNS